MGGSWEQLETDVTNTTEYQQDKTFYVQVYMSGDAKNFTPVIYTSSNADRNGNQWATNLVYDGASQTWTEYVEKHQFNNSRVAYYVTKLAPKDSWNTLRETMKTSELWRKVAAAD